MRNQVENQEVIWVCVDCFDWAANGTTPEWMNLVIQLEWRFRTRRNLKNFDGFSIGRDTSECGHDLNLDNEYWMHEEDCCTKAFSWIPCSLCESSLFASRHAITVEIKENNDV